MSLPCRVQLSALVITIAVPFSFRILPGAATQTAALLSPVSIPDDPTADRFVEGLMSRMTLSEKLGQMAQIAVNGPPASALASPGSAHHHRHTVSRVIARPPGAHLPVTDADYLAAHASNPRLQVTTMLRAGSRYQSTNISVWMIGCASCGLVQRCHAHAGDIRENI